MMRVPALLLLAFLSLTACESNGPDRKSQPRSASPAPAPAANPFVGQPLESAAAMAEAVGLPWRVIERDGQSLPATRDYRPERLNFAVRDEIVIRVTKG